MSTIGMQEFRAMLRADFYTFMMRSFAELNPRVPFLSNWHIEVMAAKLEAVKQGKIKRLAISIPPRHLKSIAASISLPAWLLGDDPTKAIINVTYGQDLSDKFARDSRAIMQSDWYRQTYPTRLLNARAPLQELTTTKGGFRLATSIGGVLTGRGADVIIIDDPLKPADAMSETRRNAVNEWYDGTLYSRLNDKTNGTIIIIMQRLHEDDLIGHVLRQEGWEIVSFPAIAEADEEYVIETALGTKKFTRRIGEPLHPEREPLPALEQIREALGTYNFACQYQQVPAPSGGGLVREAWFKSYQANELPEKFDQIIQSWDTANNPSELADYSVCTTWGVLGSKLYLLNVLRKKLGYPDLKRAVWSQYELFDPTVILIEDKASGTSLIQELIEAGLSQVTRYKPDGDKVMRLHAQTATIENGFVFLPREAHWLADYLHELTLFPNGRYDDQVDSTSQALAWAKQVQPGMGLIEYYRHRMEIESRPAPQKFVRMKPPSTISHVYAMNGQVYPLKDGCFSVPEEDVAPLRRAGFVRL